MNRRRTLTVALIFATTLTASFVSRSRADLVRILHADSEAAQARVDLVQQAKQEINVSYYIVGDDQIPLTFLSLLRDAVRRGVAVRLLIDGHTNNNQIPRALGMYLLREGVQIKEFHPDTPFRLAWVKTRMHDKLVIVDNEQLITGGRNMKDEYFGLDCQNYVDRDVYLRGCTAATARCYFMARWMSADVLPTRLCEKLGKDIEKVQKHTDLNDPSDEKAIACAGALLDDARSRAEATGLLKFNAATDWSVGARAVNEVRFLHDCPGVKKKFAGIGPDMLELLDSARCSVTLETPYMAISREMRGLLKSLACRGVHVTILTNSFETNDHHTAQAIYENNKRRYLRWGIDLRELRGCDHLHAKAAVIDGCVAVIGSYNFDELSQKKNSEVALAIYDAEVAAMLLASINIHIERSQQIGRNTFPIGTHTRYPGATPEQVHEMRVKRIITPFVKRWL